MKNDFDQTLKRINDFFKITLQFYGKEIGITSNQYFGINKIYNKENEQLGEYEYIIQYGFPQSGCVNMNFKYYRKTKSFTLDKISVYAQPANQSYYTANFAPQTQIGETSINMNFGMDTGTQEHTTLDEIENNPNALKMLDSAISDLKQAKILGDCTFVVPKGSNMIPVCTSANIIEKNKTI